MIVTRLLGGLGNQMFQYAAGRALALHHQTELLLDLSAIQVDPAGAYTKRNYELDHLNIKAKIASASDLAPFAPDKTGRLKRVLNRMFPKHRKHLVFTESGHHFHANFFNAPASTYLSGFWQNEKYFKNINGILQNELKPRDTLPQLLSPLSDLIRSTESVSVHVRRGDYVTLKSAGDFHGTCDPAYYDFSIKEISGKVGSPVFFVFSDDPDWCKKNLKIKNETHFVEHEQGAHWDMYLMSRCKHNIIANSSFSWWGAWLNMNAGKRIIVPAYWWRKVKTSSLDIVPSDWQIAP